VPARGWGAPRPLAARAIDLSPASGAGLEGGRVTIIAVDGASLDHVAQRVADGRLPAFGRLLEGGVSLYLETLRPTQPAPIWTTVATGKYPPKTGVRAAARYEYGPAEGAIELLPDYCFSHALVHFGLLWTTPYEASAVRARPLWTILSSQRVSSGVIGWPVTAPAGPIRGFLITDAFAPGALGRARAEWSMLGAPDEAVLRATAVVMGPLGVAAGSVEQPPLARDAWRREVAVQLRDEYRPRFVAVRYEGLDRAGHIYLRHARPRAFGGSGQTGEARLATILDRHYEFLDGEIAHVADTMGPDDVLFVVSGFGMEPVGLGKRMLARVLGQPDVSGSHEDAPDGFLLAYGGPVRTGRARLGSVVDVVPTVLYVLGLPIARDMDGVARTDLFTPAFTATRPIAFIPTYER
jgi:predicted AlkP superfamily phosphohydrolase/phosphomutase